MRLPVGSRISDLGGLYFHGCHLPRAAPELAFASIRGIPLLAREEGRGGRSGGGWPHGGCGHGCEREDFEADSVGA